MDAGRDAGMDPAPLDVLVVGAGPVGLAAAIEAALAGLRVAIIDPRPDPVDKACGEGLMPGAVAALARLGVNPPGMDVRGISYIAGSHRAYAPFPAGPGRGVRRTVLHKALVARAEQTGVRRVLGRVRVLTEDAGGVRAEGTGCSERARWVVAADGLHSPLRRHLGLSRPPGGLGPARPARYGLRRHYRIAPWTDLVEVHWGQDAECYLTPVAPDLVGVALLGPSGPSYAERLAGFPEVAARLRLAAPVGPVLGAGPLRQPVAARRRGRVLLVGDAAGYVDAITGEGIAVGLACARALVDCLRQGAPHDYDAAWHVASRRYRLLTETLLAATAAAPLRRALVPACALAPRVFRAVVGELAR
jgi:flavin-dependent dehydrogenase